MTTTLLFPDFFGNSEYCDNATCSPSRVSLLSGEVANGHFVGVNSDGSVPSGAYATLECDAGYISTNSTSVQCLGKVCVGRVSG